jgi:hypothetical protein
MPLISTNTKSSISSANTALFSWATTSRTVAVFPVPGVPEMYMQVPVPSVIAALKWAYTISNSVFLQGREAGTADTCSNARAWRYGEEVKCEGERTRVPRGVNSSGFLTTILYDIAISESNKNMCKERATSHRLLVGVVNTLRRDCGVTLSDIIRCFLRGVTGSTSSSLCIYYIDS